MSELVLSRGRLVGVVGDPVELHQMAVDNWWTARIAKLIYDFGERERKSERPFGRSLWLFFGNTIPYSTFSCGDGEDCREFPSGALLQLMVQSA